MEILEMLFYYLSYFIFILFMLCVGFLYLLSILFHFNYQETSVYFNLYFQGILPILTGLFVLYKVRKSWIKIIFTLIGIGLNSWLFKWIIERYPIDKIEYSFNKCVADLNLLADKLDSNYIAVNIYIFIIGFLLNMFYYIHILLSNRYKSLFEKIKSFLVRHKKKIKIFSIIFLIVIFFGGWLVIMNIINMLRFERFIGN